MTTNNTEDEDEYVVVKLFVKAKKDTPAGTLPSHVKDLDEVADAAYTDAFMEGDK